jgi:hypothetical protein
VSPLEFGKSSPTVSAIADPKPSDLATSYPFHVVKSPFSSSSGSTPSLIEKFRHSTSNRQTASHLLIVMFTSRLLWGESKDSEWNIKQINQFSQLDMIGELIDDALRDFPRFIKDIAKNASPFSSFTNTQVIAIGLITPIPLNPKVAYQVLVKVVNSSGFCGAPVKWQLACLMRLVRASSLAHKSRELFLARTVHDFHERDPKTFQVSLFYLYVESLNFIDAVPELTHDLRADAITFYYSGLNRLLHRQFAIADEHLQRSWVLSKAAKDMRTSIVNKMSLAAFLAGAPRAVFDDRLPHKYLPTGTFLNIWNLDGKYKQGDVTGAVCSHLTAEITEEHTRRLILDMALSTSVLPVAMVKERLGVRDLDGSFEKMRREGTINLKIESDAVVFSRPSLVPVLEAELAELKRRYQ